LSGNRRLERVSDLLREVASEVIREIKDPAVADTLVSIIRVDVSPDLSSAHFQVSVLAEPDQQKRVLEGLNRASGFIRHGIKQQVRMKRVPSVNFTLDQSLAYGAHISAIISKVRENTPAVSEADVP
jgi:ribosome-binding factor A